MEQLGTAGPQWTDRPGQPQPKQLHHSISQRPFRVPHGLAQPIRGELGFLGGSRKVCVGGRPWQGGQLRDLCNSHSLLGDSSRTVTVAPPLGVNQNAESLGCPHLSFRAYSQGSLLDTSGHKTQTSSKYKGETRCVLSRAAGGKGGSQGLRPSPYHSLPHGGLRCWAGQPAWALLFRVWPESGRRHRVFREKMEQAHVLACARGHICVHG